MSVTIIPTSEVRNRIAWVINRARSTGEPVFITRYSRPEAVLLSYERYQAMMDLLEDREDETDSELGRRVAEGRAAYERGESRDLDELTNELEGLVD